MLKLSSVSLLVSVLCAFHGPCRGQSPVPGTVPLTPEISPDLLQVFDNTKGNLIRHQLGHLRPIAIDPTGTTIVAPNNAGQRLTFMDLSTGNLVAEIPTGPGITAIAYRPGTSEIWAIDSVNNCISVIVQAQQQIVRTIDVGKHPHGIVFLSGGDRAYVTNSADNTVSVIDCAAYAEVATIDIPAMGPRGIAVENDQTVWVVPLYSGNNTVTRQTVFPPLAGDVSTQEIVQPDPTAGEVALPDRDLLAITVTPNATTDSLDPARTQTDLGTILFNAHVRPGSSELWIPNTDARNLLVGEKNFIDGKVVSNRITIVNTATFATQVVDLDALAQPLGVGCAQPGAVAFSSNGAKAYVAGFGSDIVLELDANTLGANGFFRLEPVTPSQATSAARCGPRGLVFSPGGTELLAFNNLDNSFSRVDVTALNSVAPVATPLGYDPTPAAVKRGLGHLANADFSATKTSSCFSCHVDGHFDMLSWDLSAYSDPASETVPPQFEQDNKGPMATQSLRGLFETGALHWRGERVNLETFNEAFELLLKNGAPLSPAEFADLELGAQSLVYPANPRQPIGRNHKGVAADGLWAFLHVPADNFGSCATCHAPPHGTNAEVQPATTTFFPTHATKVSQLRGVQDKLAPPLQVFPGGSHPFRTENGWGLNHGAGLAALGEFVDQFAPGMPDPAQRAAIAAYVSQFDTGLAPATTWQRTINPATHSPTEFDKALEFIKGQAVAGHCDAVVIGAGDNGNGLLPYGLVYDHVLDRWQTPTGWATFDKQQLTFLTYSSGLTVTFMGMPLGAGRRFAVDRDNDGLLNDDEANYAPYTPSAITNPDTDGDGFPDGHEVANGDDPRVANASSQDTTDPVFTRRPRVIYVTSSTAKLEFSTNEPTFARVLGPHVATVSPAAGGFDVNHSILVRELEPNTATTFTVEITDPAQGVTTMAVSWTGPLAPTNTQEGSRVASIATGTYNSTTKEMPVDVHIENFLDGTPLTGYTVEIMAYAEASTQPLTMIHTSTSAISSAGVASFTISIPTAIDNAMGRKLHIAVLAISFLPSGNLFYLEPKDVTLYEAFNF